MTDNTPPEDGVAVPQASTEYALTALSRVGLHKKTREAIEAMAYEGLSLPLAADRFDIRRDNLTRAFNKPHVRTAFKQVVKAITDNAAQQAYLRVNHLSQTSKSERLQYDASRWVAGVAGISPVQKVQGHMTHNVTFGGFDYDEPIEHDPKVTPPKVVGEDDE